MTVNVQSYALNIAAGASLSLSISGSYFRLFDTTGALTVTLDTGSKFAGILAGQGQDGEKFTSVRIYNGTGSTVTGSILVSDQKFIDQRIVLSSASVTITALTGNTQAAATVTNVTGTLVAANASRRHILIQNKDAAGIIWLNFTGAAATTANGIKLGPGDSISLGAEEAGLSEITAIGDLASNANVVYKEGT